MFLENSFETIGLSAKLSCINYKQEKTYKVLKPAAKDEELTNLIQFGASPRGSINLAKAARVHAFIKRRGYVTPEDVRSVCNDVLRHRIGLTYEAEAESITTEQVIDKILNTIEVP